MNIRNAYSYGFALAKRPGEAVVLVAERVGFWTLVRDTEV